MRHLPSAALLLVALCGCAATPKARALQTAIVTKQVMDEFSVGWETYVDHKITECRGQELPTPEAREACLGFAAKSDEVVIAASLVVTAQEAIYVAAKCEKPELATSLRLSCPEEETFSWKDLSDDLLGAWERLRPIIVELRNK